MTSESQSRCWLSDWKRFLLSMRQSVARKRPVGSTASMAGTSEAASSGSLSRMSTPVTTSPRPKRGWMAR